MSIHVRIVTQRALVMDTRVDEVRLPGYHGEFGVLPGHARLLTQVRPGLLHIRLDDGDRTFVVGRGFAEVGPLHVTLLVDLFEDLAGVDRDKAAADLQEAEAKMVEMAVGMPKRDLVERAADLARARLGS